MVDAVHHETGDVADDAACDDGRDDPHRVGGGKRNGSLADADHAHDGGCLARFTLLFLVTLGREQGCQRHAERWHADGDADPAHQPGLGVDLGLGEQGGHLVDGAAHVKGGHATQDGPSITLPEPAMLESQWFIPSIMAAMGAPITHITMPHTRKVPMSG